MKIKHVVIPEFNVIELQELEINDQLQPDEILIETEASFISPGTEIAVYQAKEKVYKKGSFCEYPWKAGYSNVGTIVSVGSAVTSFQPGQRVFTHGGHGSRIVVKDSKHIVEVPEAIDSPSASLTRMVGISATSLYVADIPTNGWVAVYGLGMVGNLAAQIFQIMGCRVIGIDPNETRRALAERCGIQYTVGGHPEEVQNAIEELTQGELCQISVDAVGHSKVIMQAMKSTAKFGQVILLGTPRDPVEGNLTELLADIHMRWISVRGALNLPDLKRQREIQKLAFDWVETGRLKLEPLISHRLPPEQFKEAYEGLMTKQEEYTGVVFIWK